MFMRREQRHERRVGRWQRRSHFGGLGKRWKRSVDTRS
jgi:hypothetical protein